MMKKIAFTLMLLFLSLAATAQSVVWVAQGSGPQSTYGNAIARDDDGFLYVTGKFRDSVTFGTFQLLESNFGSPYCVKYDSMGTVIWALKDVGGNGVVYDGGNHIYLWNEENLSMQKLDLGGNAVWNKPMLTTSQFGSSGIMDGHASPTALYITGYLSGDGYFGVDTVLNAGNWDVFVARYDVDGNPVWAQGGGSAGLDKGYAVFPDGHGNVYATGYFADTAQFGGTALTSAGSKDAYLAKYTELGTQLWAKAFGGAGFDLAAAMVQDEAGALYFTGRFHTEINFGGTTLVGSNLNAFITKVDADGNAIWAQAIAGQGDDEEADLAYAGGQLHFICTTSGDVVADNHSLTGLGGLDMAIGKMDTLGNVLGMKLYGGSQNDEGAGLTLGGVALYFCGSFNDVGTFDAFSLTSASSWDVVTGKLQLDGATAIASPGLGAGELGLFPNPAQAVVTLRFPDALEAGLVQVWDLRGVPMMEVAVSQGEAGNIDVSALPSGIYVVTLARGADLLVARLVRR